MLIIRGIEVTQAIQYYRADQHLTDPADRGPDNSLKLVAGKPAWVRVYVENDEEGDIENVTGTLEVGYTLLNERFGESNLVLEPEWGNDVTAEFDPDYEAVRSSLTRTINFLIPADRMFGPLGLTATVNSDGGEPVTKSVVISASLRQTLKVRGVMIGYNGPDPDDPGSTLTLPAPTLGSLQGVAATALKIMPVQSNGVFQVASTLTRTEPLAAGGSGCGAGWVDLNAAIAAVKTADGNPSGYLYYGLLPGGFPNDAYAIGCAAGGVASGFDFAPVTFVHEIGHLCGRAHAPYGHTVEDPNYPVYEPYDSPAYRYASIGEYGIDIVVGGAVPVPENTADYMAPFGGPWVSIYGHQALINNDKLNPEYVGGIRPWWKDIRMYDPWWWLHHEPDPPPYWIDADHIREFPARRHRVISVIGKLHSDERVEILSVTRTQVTSTRLAGRESDLRVVLHGARNVELVSMPMFEMNSQAACGCGCCGNGGAKQRPVMLQAFLPDKGIGSGLSIRRGKAAVWKRAATRGVLSVSTPKVRNSKEKDTVEVSWVAKPPRAIQDTWVRVSVDQGKSWRSAATGLTRPPALLNRNHLPAGKLLVQVVVHDGFRSVESKAVEFDNGALPPVVVILYPDPKLRLVAGEALCLWGSAAGHVDQPSGEFRYAWTVDGKRAGDGLQVYTRVPAPGKHRCQLTVRNSSGQVVASSECEFVSVSEEDARKR